MLEEHTPVNPWKSYCLSETVFCIRFSTCHSEAPGSRLRRNRRSPKSFEFHSSNFEV
jgi:hypothetical protein